jgi:hypothetical protein
MQTLTKEPTLAPSIPAPKISKIRSARSGVIIQDKFEFGVRNTRFSDKFYNFISEPQIAQILRDLWHAGATHFSQICGIDDNYATRYTAGESEPQITKRATDYTDFHRSATDVAEAPVFVGSEPDGRLGDGSLPSIHLRRVALGWALRRYTAGIAVTQTYLQICENPCNLWLNHPCNPWRL